MTNIIKKIATVMSIAMLVFCAPLVSLAQGTTSISVSNNTPGVGEYTTVSVTASASGTVTIKYTASMMTLIDCSASGYTSEGNVVTFSGTAGDLKFQANNEGTASVIVSSSSCAGSSTTITIGSTSTNDSASDTDSTASDSTTEETAETTETTEETTTTDETTATDATTSISSTGTLNSDGGFDIDGVSYVVSERYSDSEIPTGFSKVNISISGHTYNELSNGSIVIIYLKPADNTEGDGIFYIYDEASSTVSSFAMVGDSSSYIILSTADSTLPDTFYETTFTNDYGTYTAYTLEGSEFYYFYGTNQNGVTGWFAYDATYGGTLRLDTALANSSSSSTSTDEEDDEDTTTYDSTEIYQTKLEKLRLYVSILVVACVILIFALINICLKKKGDSEDEEEYDSDDIFARPPVKAGKRGPRSIIFDDPDAPEDDEDEEDDEDDGVLNKPKTKKKDSKEDSDDLNMIDFDDL